MGAAVVLAGFMGGLGLGNWLIARYGHCILRPIQFYVALEILIGTTGLLLVLIFPFLPKLLSPLFQLFLEQPFLLNHSRISSTFILLLIPTIAMGATLPLMVKIVCNVDKNYGFVLGRLYGWNTLGAVFGVILCEFILIEWLGIRNSSFIAVIFNLAAILLALRLIANIDSPKIFISSGHETYNKRLQIPIAGWRMLCAIFLIGMLLLALEVIWFRFLLLTKSGTSVTFAVMLALVLTGIGLGGLFSSWLYKRQLSITSYSNELALLGGIFTAVTYICFDLIYFNYVQKTEPSLLVFLIYASFLILPNSVISGMIFTTLGQSIKHFIPVETSAIGMLTLSNTIGAMIGALIAGFVLLSVVGMENSFWLVTLGYGLVAFMIPNIGSSYSKRKVVLKYSLQSVLLLFIIFFPFGLMKEFHFQKVFERWGASKVIAIKEGLVATNSYFLYEVLGKPYFYRLMTNGHSMSGTSLFATRYMKLFVYWPIALHPELKNALLISYGVGSTAKALVDTSTLDSIDIVDISKDILDMSSILYPNPKDHPLNDIRVKLHIEDGRFFLQTSEKKHDLITGEPPPPKLNQIVNLYTQEYFQLIYNHLNKGGITTYWLPAHQLQSIESKSTIKAFCNVFKDCSLWTGAGLEWMLIGTKNLIGPGTVEKFTKQWNE